MRSSAYRSAAEDGFTLIEVLVAALILAIGIMATAVGFADSQHATRTTQRQDIAATLAEKALEQVKALPYSQVAVNAAYPAVQTGPLSQLSATGSTFTVPSTGAAEETVAANAATPIPPTQTVTVGSGTEATAATIYTFVSWRGESCPVINLTQLSTTVYSLQQVLNTLDGPGGVLSSLVGPSGSLSGAVLAGNTLITGPLGGVLGAVLAPLQAIITDLSAINTTLTPINSAVAPLLTPATNLLDPVTHKLTGTLNLCNLPNITGGFKNVKTLTTALQSLQPILTNLGPAVADVTSTVQTLSSLNVVTILTATTSAAAHLTTDLGTISSDQTQINNVLAAAVDDAGNPRTVTNLAADVSTSLSNLHTWLNTPTSTHQTKRVSIAVVLQSTPASLGITKPVWVTGVVTDPNVGLL